MKKDNPKLKEFLSEFSVAVITGGSSGIGEAFLKTVNSFNPDIAFCNISRSPLGPSANGCKILFDDSCDISNPVEFGGALEKIKKIALENLKGKRLLLINNAGIACYGEFSQIPLEENLKIIDVNVRALVSATKFLMPEIISSKGAVINLASTAAFQPTPVLSIYGATKSFVLHWTIALAAELEKHGCTATAVCPGPTKTKFFDRAKFDTKHLPDKFGPTSEDVALDALEALRRKKAYSIVGKFNRFLITLSGLVPLSSSGRIAYKVMMRQRSKALR